MTAFRLAMSERKQRKRQRVIRSRLFGPTNRPFVRPNPSFAAFG